MARKNIKIVLIGDYNSGKSSLVSAYLFGKPILPTKPVIFSSYCREINIKGDEYRLTICDSSGITSVARLQSMSYLDADLLVICIDISKKNSLRQVEDYVNGAKDSNVPMILCANKIDLEPQITDNMIRTFVEQHSMNGYIKCSALDNKMVNEVFDRMLFFANSGVVIKKSSCVKYFNCCY